MNLNAYDNVEEDFNKSTWVNPQRKKLYSKDIIHQPYYGFLKRFNPKTGKTDYYLLLTSKIPDNIRVRGTTTMKHGGVSMSMSPIWNECPMKDYTKTTYIDVRLVEFDDDNMVYYLDI